MQVRRFVLPLALVVALVLAAAAAAQQPLPPAAQPGSNPDVKPDPNVITAEYRARVDAAVARAARWLEKKRGRKADFGPLTEEGAMNSFNFPSGLTALSYFTLLTAGVSPKKPSMKAIFRRLQRRHRRRALRG